MRDRGITTLAICGIALEIGIEPTVRHAADVGIVPVVIADACGAGHADAGQRSIDQLAFLGDAFITDEEDFGRDSRLVQDRASGNGKGHLNGRHRGRVAERGPAMSSEAVRVDSVISASVNASSISYPEIPNRVFDFGVSKQNLNSSKIACGLVYQGCLGTAERVCFSIPPDAVQSP